MYVQYPPAAFPFLVTKSISSFSIIKSKNSLVSFDSSEYIFLPHSIIYSGLPFGVAFPLKNSNPSSTYVSLSKPNLSSCLL